MKHPIYLALAGLSCIYLATAHLRGWNPIYSLLPLRWGPSGPSLYHK